MTDSNRDTPNVALQSGWVKASLSLDDVRHIKAQATYDAPFADRIGFGLAVRLLQIRQSRGEDRDVLHEINVLEGIDPHSSTKPATQFRHAPLYPFWHKHFSTSRHLFPNIGIRWAIEQGGNRDLTKMLETVAREHGDQPGMWQKKVAYDFVLGGLQDRAAASKMTGDWIIFARHEEQNYYLDLASHQEGNEPTQLLKKLRDANAWEFPFLFSTAG